MHIREYPPVYKDGKKIVNGSNMHGLVNEFTSQMFERGKTTFSYFADRDMIYDMQEDDEDFGDLPSGISFTQDFTPEDMMGALMAYLDASMDKKSKLAFVTQIHNYILNDIIYDSSFSDDGYDDETGV
jgi:hypothetical protein